MQAAGRTRVWERLGRAFPGQLLVDVPLAPWTSVRVGGAAELWARPAHPDALVELLRIAREEGAPITVLGGGANTLVGDFGVPGVLLKLPADFAPEQVAADEGGAQLTVGAGAAIARLIVLMKAHRLVGAEFLAGIPGTLGGAVTMNAGTKHGECMSVVEAVELATANGVGWLARAELPYRYRATQLPQGAVVTRVRFRLGRGDLAQSQAQMEADLGYRKRTQPLSQPNFGSVFKNPAGDHAGRLIEQVGLKGQIIGRAQISTLHANWIVNLGGAKAAEVVALMALAQQRVREATGHELQPEVKRIGVFTPEGGHG
jgi:UDP-N-acetylmuramate dehydrogenase